MNENITYCKLEETWILASFLSLDVDYVLFPKALRTWYFSFTSVYNIFIFNWLKKEWNKNIKSP